MTLFFCLIMASFWASGACPAAQYSKDQLDARYYDDLGPSRIDVSSYPAEQQRNYKEFAEHCSKCHTLARPINAPIVTRRDWERYVDRMRSRTNTKEGSEISKEETTRIVNFLVYDSQRRKIQQKAHFNTETARLKRLFDDVQKERLRVKEEENQKKAKPAPMEMQTQPSPHP